MDFFARQDQARRNTKLLVAYFVMAVIAIVTLVYLAVVLIFNGASTRHHRYDDYQNYASASGELQLWNPPLFFGVLVGTLGVIVAGSAWKTAQLSGGGGGLALQLGGRPVDPNTTDPNERKLLNVVEEMAIASGVPVPEVYVLDREEGINAFAAGHTPSDAAIGVTRGCVTMLNRDELQGVIGHEFSHILNGDMRLNLRLLGIIFGILCIATIGRVLLYARSGNSRDRNALPLLGLVLLALGGIGVFFGRLIQAAVSRQREFLADASSVQFTRNPAGLSHALQKIGRYSFGSRLQSEHAADACHMFFSNGVSESLVNAMATHPPIDQRIRAIDPAWDGKFPPLTPAQAGVIEKAALADLRQSGKSPILGSPLGDILGGLVIASEAEDAPRRQTPPPVPAQSVLPNLGQPTPLHLHYAEQLRNALPDSLKTAAHDPLGAVALIYAMLLSPDEATRATQLAELARRDSALQARVAALYPVTAPVADHTRLPLVNLALPALRRLRVREYADFSDTLQWLIESDRQVDLFEFVLQKIVKRHLATQFGEVRRAVVQYYSIKPLLPDCAVLLSALALVGSSDAAAVGAAFRAGAPYLRSPVGEVSLLPREQCGLEQLDAALNRLDQAAPQIKKNLIEAAVRVVGADGVIQEAEAELLRAIADTLDCPIPPFVTTDEDAPVAA